MSPPLPPRAYLCYTGLMPKKPLRPRHRRKATSWEGVEGWYRGIVGEKGSYYHQRIVMPGVLKLLDLQKNSSLLDLACGQGVLARNLPFPIPYTGVDLSASLIKSAKEQSTREDESFFVGDITESLPVKKKTFTHATIILALQNIEDGAAAIKNAANHLKKGGRLVIVLNHPYFRIPRQSAWGVDEDKKVQFRRVERYLSPIKIPIQAHPSKGKSSAVTWSFHNSLATYTEWFLENGMMIEKIEEWCSDKKSTGSKARMEDRARKEFPLFMAISVIKA